MLPRVTTQSAPEGDGGDESDGGKAVVGEAIVSGSDASPILDAAEHALDEVATLIGEAVERVWPGASGAGGDYRLDVVLGQRTSDGIGIIGFVAKQAAGWLDPGQQGRSYDVVGGVAGGEDEGDGPAASVSQRVDLARPPAARAADRFGYLPLFPPPAERWTLTWVASIASSSGTAPMLATCSNSRRQMPRRAHRL
jgi:hypothetical protein